MKQASKKNTKKYLWRSAMIFVIAVLLLATLGSYLASNLLLKKINNLQIEGISVKADHAEVHFLLNNFTLENVEITDSTKNSLHIPEINLDGLHYFQLLFSKKIEIDKLSIKRPQFSLKLPFKMPATDSDSKSGIGDYEILLNKIEVIDSEVNMKQQKGFLQLTNLNIKLKDFQKFGKSDSVQKKLQFGDIEIDADDFLYTLKDSLYLFKAKQLAVSSQDKTIRIGDASILSNHSKYEIGHRTGVETDWYHLLFGTINIDGFEPEALKNEQSLQFACVTFEKLEADIFRDKRLPFPDKPDTKLPMEIINSLPFPLHIDSVLIKAGKVKYEEHVKDAQKAGAIVLSSLHGKLYEISNNENLIDKPTIMKADARVMGEGLLDVNFEFPNKKFPEEYHVVGSLQPMELKPINPILRENVRAEIESGKLNTFRFNFTYNDDVAQGSLLMEYNNLKVSMLKTSEDDKKEFKTFLVNSLALRSSNQRNENNFQAGEIDFERLKKKSFFNYWWKSLLSGIKSVVVTVK